MRLEKLSTVVYSIEEEDRRYRKMRAVLISGQCKECKIPSLSTVIMDRALCCVHLTNLSHISMVILVMFSFTLT